MTREVSLIMTFEQRLERSEKVIYVDSWKKNLLFTDCRSWSMPEVVEEPQGGKYTWSQPMNKVKCKRRQDQRNYGISVLWYCGNTTIPEMWYYRPEDSDLNRLVFCKSYSGFCGEESTEGQGWKQEDQSGGDCTSR